MPTWSWLRKPALLSTSCSKLGEKVQVIGISLSSSELIHATYLLFRYPTKPCAVLHSHPIVRPLVQYGITLLDELNVWKFNSVRIIWLNLNFGLFRISGIRIRRRTSWSISHFFSSRAHLSGYQIFLSISCMTSMLSNVTRISILINMRPEGSPTCPSTERELGISSVAFSLDLHRLADH